MKNLVALCLFAFAGTALAQNAPTLDGINPPPPPSPVVSSSSNSASDATAISGSASRAQSNQAQDQGQAQRQGQSQNAVAQQGQTQGQSANNKQGQSQSQGQENTVGNVNVINFPDVPDETKTRLYNAPSVTLGVMNPTTPCFATYQAGVSGMGFGVAVGGGVIDEECTRRENARMLSAIGENASAISLLCGNAEVARRATVLCGRAEAIAMRGAPQPAAPAKQADLPAPGKQSKDAPPKDVAPKDAPPKDALDSGKQGKDAAGEPAVKEYKQDGKTFRWQNGGWQPTMDVPPATVEGRDLLVQAAPRR